MTVERIAITDRAAWLQLRTKDVTASQIGALFSVHPWSTVASVYASKSGMDLDGDDVETALMRRGNLLEPVVGAEVARLRPAWQVIKCKEYLRDPEARIGCTPDFLIHGDPRGLGILQTKTTGSWQFKKGWGSADELMPPLWIVLQAATEMMLADAAFAAIGVLVIGDFQFETHVIELPRVRGAEARIRAAVRLFWAQIEAGEVPVIDASRDGDLVRLMYPHETHGKIVDLTGDNRILELLDQREALAGTIKFAEGKKVEAETEIRSKLGDAEAALVRGWRSVTLRTTHRKEHVVKASSYRTLRATRDSA